MTQFLGHPRPGALLGSAEYLSFVGFAKEPDGSFRVGLTPDGFQLTTLENPIFDTRHPDTTFSVMESRFFLEHLQRRLPDEYVLMRFVAKLIDEGNDRTELNKQIAAAYPDWESFVTTMRAGVIGRLHDLGFLIRVRKAQQVEYSLSELAYDLGLVER